MEPIPIIPRYKLLVQYDVRPDVYERYYQYVVGEFVPALQKMGLYMIRAWHTAYGDQPLRQVEFVSDSLETIQEAMENSRWQLLEERLKGYTSRYQRKIVPYRNGFQF